MSGAAEPAARRALPLSLPVLAASALTVILGAGVAVAVAPLAWAVDIDRNLRAADALRTGAAGTVEGYLYTPLAALLTIPLALLPAGVAVGAWLVARVALVLAGVRRETEDWAIGDRWAAAAAALAFVPTLHDLLLGNVSIVMTAGVALVAWGRDSWRSGVVLGLVLATIPKPQLLPILVWMLVFRRRALLGTIGAGLAATGAGVVLLGFERYIAFADYVLHAPYLGTAQFGNLGLTGLLPDWVVPLGLITVVATGLAFWRGETAGLVCAICAGILLAPYSMAYSAVPLLLAVRPMSRVAPRATFLLAITASLGVVTFLPLWLAAVMAAALIAPLDLPSRAVPRTATMPAI